MGRRLLLVGWDSADWQIIHPLVDAGKMPVLQRLMESGVSGRLASLEPMVSPLLWTSIATGKRAHAHGIYSFTASQPETGIVASAGSVHRTCHALWNILHHEQRRSVVCNWFASHPAEPVDGLIVSNEFPVAPSSAGEAVQSRAVHPVAHWEKLQALRVRPEDIDGSIIRLFVPRAAEVDQENDPRLARLATLLAENFNVHSAFTYGLEAVPWDFAAVYYEAIDLIAHHFMRYVAPLMPGVPRRDAEIYGEVLEGAYRLHDAMLGRVLELAGADTTVMLVSDHGFHSRHDRPAQLPAVPLALTRWHRQQGVLVMNGPGVKRDALVYGASLLDIVPTILSFFELPVGADMEGRVLTEAFLKPPARTTIPSWDNVQGAFGRIEHSAESFESSHLLQRFIDLGYLAAAGGNTHLHAPQQWRIEQYFRALALLDAQRPHDALPILDALHEAEPERDDIALALGTTLLRLGLLEEAAEVIDLLQQTTSLPGALQLRADLERRRGDRSAALRALASIENIGGDSVVTLNLAGATYVQLRELAKAEECFQRSLEIDKENPSALAGLSLCKTRQGLYAAAAELSLEGISLLYHHFYSHYCYGVALIHLGDEENAIRAFENALRFNPRFHPARHYLVYLFKRRPSSKTLLETHRGGLFARALDQQQSELRRANLREELHAARRERARARAEHRMIAPAVDRLDRQSALELLIISGLPRSGTSLVMQMMEAAGIPPRTDGVRVADTHNPHGYYEWERIKELPRHPELIAEAAGSAVKVVSPLLPFLPKQHHYRIVFLRRELEPMLDSQDRMRSASVTGHEEREKTRRETRAHLERSYRLLEASANISWIEIQYEKLLQGSDLEIERLAGFCRIAPDRITKMKSVIGKGPLAACRSV